MSAQKLFDSSTFSWQDWQEIDASELSRDRRADIEDPGSLTQRLMNASGGDFRVEVVDQSWSQPTEDECQVLGLSLQEQALIREVKLICRGQVWILARSVIPHASLKGRLADITELGNKPLGEMLFAEPSLERTSFEVCRVDAKALKGLGEAISNDGGPAWGRRSVFRVEGLPVLVAEIFLDSCPSLT